MKLSILVVIFVLSVGDVALSVDPSSVEDLIELVKNLQHQVDNLTELEERVELLEVDVLQLQQSVINLDASQTDLVQTLNDTYGFLAVGTEDIACVNDKLQFGEVRLNSGNAFDPSTSSFTAPVAGLYEFTMFLISTETSSSQEYWLEKNGDQQCEVTVEGVLDDNVFITSTCSATMELAPGDQVDIFCTDVDVLGTSDNNGFTGALIQPYL